ncbi:key lime pathogenicity protein [Dendryphion nanum]|uniref:Key lime pathogenicity protein n=1 Tax=Dendryphion nanum TaxID=256645 RepID=A0A9P9DRQ9_9PLEO|nr:key lime pathogenicity protein [Dendryphion nanum]
MADTSYLLILQQAKDQLWSKNLHLTEEERQALWTQTIGNTDINHNALTFNNTYNNLHPQSSTRMDQVPRSMSSMSSLKSFNAAAMAQLSEADVAAMDRTASAPAAVTMGRAVSNSNIADAWSLDDQTPEYTHYSLTNQARPQSSLQPIHEVPTFGTDCMEYTPDEYINTLSPHSFPPTSLSSRFQVAPLTTDARWSPSFDDSLSPSSSPALLTPATASDSSMSREGSSYLHMFDDISMLRVHSDSSNVMPIPSGDMSQFPLFDSNISECVDSSLSFPFTASHGERFSSPAYPSSVSTLESSQQQLDLAEDMRRSASSSSDSDTSHASASSGFSRHVRREREVNLSASRKIAPKVEPSDETKCASSNIQMKRVVSQDGSSKDFAAITKVPYTRPQHPKMYCPHCTERQEGFRGTHELERHVARKHATVRKAYICIDASDNQKFLSGCKHCRNGKEYGAYYNAAAHLRRAHFHPRKKGRKAKGDEKRGGIGGGDHPAMDYLKQHWIKEIEVRGDLNSGSSRRRSPSADLSDNTEDSSVNNFEYPEYDSMDTSYLAPPTVDISPIPTLDSTSFIEQNNYLHPSHVFDPYGSSDIANFQFDAYTH